MRKLICAIVALVVGGWVMAGPAPGERPVSVKCGETKRVECKPYLGDTVEGKGEMRAEVAVKCGPCECDQTPCPECPVISECEPKDCAPVPCVGCLEIDKELKTAKRSLAREVKGREKDNVAWQARIEGVRPKPFWFVPVSALYLEAPGVAAGLGYQWANGVSVMGQAMYRRVNDDGYMCPECGCESGPLVSVERSGVGGMVTATIPLRRR